MRGLLMLALSAALLCGGCGRPAERIEWPVMGTVAAVQYRGAGWNLKSATGLVRQRLAEVERLLNAHDPVSELSRLASLPDAEVLARCDPSVRPCYRAALRLRDESGGVFNPRWRGTNTLDLGAIAKGYAVDRAADAFYVDNDSDGRLIDLGGNLKSVHGEWRTGVRDPQGEGLCATVTLRRGEALATSAEYFRGPHIHDGRTGGEATSGVLSVTVLHPSSAMLADGLSTTLFLLGRERGNEFLARHYPEAHAYWVTADGQAEEYAPKGAERRFTAVGR